MDTSDPSKFQDGFFAFFDLTTTARVDFDKAGAHLRLMDVFVDINSLLRLGTGDRSR